MTSAISVARCSARAGATVATMTILGKPMNGATMNDRAAAKGRPAGQTGGSGCGDVRGIAPPRAISSGLSAALPPYSERWSNNPPQGLHSSTGSVDNSRPPMSRLTAKTLRMAHAKVMNIHRLGGIVPQGLVLLERDYKAWRRRVQRGTQRETLMGVPWSAEVRQP